jgi:hypothetical protein
LVMMGDVLEWQRWWRDVIVWWTWSRGVDVGLMLPVA